ncbi:MAG: CoA transferase, partial [Anaerolineales bacterium]|nr:CoA transferase [Anaerolineales bacterium]
SLKILDFSTLLPGPYGSMMLADMGANVLRIEAPHRPDMVRFLPPFDSDASAWHSLLNRNKRSIALDLKQPQAVEIVKRLVRDGGYDIVLEQFRPGVMDRLGVGYGALSAINPQLIYCAVTGYGQTGPYRDRAGHDNNYLALSGIMSHSRRKGELPPPLGVQVADIGGGAFGAVTGILTAVIHRQVTGEGQFVDVSMLDMVIAWQAHVVSHVLVGDEVPEPEGWALNGGGYYDFYETKDGRFLSVGSLEPKFWQGFCDAIERPDLIPLGINQDLAVQKSLKNEIRAAIKLRDFDAWCAVFAEVDVCVEPVLTVPEMLAHPQVRSRGMVVEVPKSDGQMQSQIGPPIKFSRSQPNMRHTGIEMGQNTAQILTEIGYDTAEIETLREAGVFGK